MSPFALVPTEKAGRMTILMRVFEALCLRLSARTDGLRRFPAEGSDLRQTHNPGKAGLVDKVGLPDNRYCLYAECFLMGYWAGTKNEKKGILSG